MTQTLSEKDAKVFSWSCESLSSSVYLLSYKWHHSRVFSYNFEQINVIHQAFQFLTLNMSFPAGLIEKETK